MTANKTERIALFIFAPTLFFPRIETMILGHVFDSPSFNSLPTIKKILLFPTYAQHRRANPRSEIAMAELMKSKVLNDINRCAIDALLPFSWIRLAKSIQDHQIARPMPYDPVDLLNTLRSMLQTRTYDHVYLFYPDAIGLGWSSIEQVLLDSSSATITVVNGRKRIFEINKTTLKRLYWHRFIERSWIPEIFLIIILIPLSVLLFIVDLFKRNRLPNHDLA